MDGAETTQQRCNTKTGRQQHQSGRQRAVSDDADLKARHGPVDLLDGEQESLHALDWDQPSNEQEHLTVRRNVAEKASGTTVARCEHR